MFLLYIFWLLHQTTTSRRLRLILQRCISFDSYIKPQHGGAINTFLRVVYLLTPTSNHNFGPWWSTKTALYIFWLLHQTTTRRLRYRYRCMLYIFWLLHQTTTCSSVRWASATLYIFWLLHQTTTCFCSINPYSCCISFDSYIKPQPVGICSRACWGCISFDSYIKPQLASILSCERYVVYLLTPTSNHNWVAFDAPVVLLYIFWLLHQTTTQSPIHQMATGCISFDSYIKPQPVLDYAHIGIVVYLLTPTSNHNFDTICSLSAELYIFWLLHQTTTKRGCACRFQRCISFDSYIKPQHSGLPQNAMGVVYLLTPTSNHNTLMSPPLCKQLYIFWLLHQTTT